MSAICVFTNNSHKNIKGNVVFKPTKRGLQITVNMEGLKPGLHGFHIHQYGDLSEEFLSHPQLHRLPDGPSGTPDGGRRRAWRD